MSVWASPPQTPDFAAKLRAAEAELAKTSPRMAELVRHGGPCSLAPDPDSFAVLTRSVVSQLISTAAAKAITARLYAACGGELTPERLLGLTDAELKACGFSAGKMRAARGVAEAFAAPGFAEALAASDGPGVRALLLPLFGVGGWTADMLCIFSLGHLDVFPAGDLVVRAGLKTLLGLAETPAERAAQRLGAAWTPWRSVAAWYLWAGENLGAGRRAVARIGPSPAASRGLTHAVAIGERLLRPGAARGARQRRGARRARGRPGLAAGRPARPGRRAGGAAGPAPGPGDAGRRGPRRRALPQALADRLKADADPTPLADLVDAALDAPPPAPEAVALDDFVPPEYVPPVDETPGIEEMVEPHNDATEIALTTDRPPRRPPSEEPESNWKLWVGVGVGLWALAIVMWLIYIYRPFAAAPPAEKPARAKGR